jgi:uncharacterized membrane protein
VIYQVPFVTACLLPLFYYILVQPFKAFNMNRAGKLNSIKQFFQSLLKLKIAMFFFLSLVALFSYLAVDHSAIYFPPIIMILLILYPFARSLMPGRTPLISLFYQLTEQENDPFAMDYTKKVTWVWLVFIIVLLLNTLFLTFFASLERWSLFTNFINYILMLALFVGEWIFRMLWFKKWFSPLRFFKQLMTIDQRELLR